MFVLAPHVGICDVSLPDSNDVKVEAPSGCRDQIGFADALREEGDYYRAITEYKRALYFCRDDSLSARARAGVGKALFDAGRYDLVLDWYRRLGDEDARLPHAELLAGRSLFRLGSYDGAVDLLGPLHGRVARSAQTGDASYYVGLSQIRIGSFRQAEGSLSLVGDASPCSDRARRHLELLRSEPRPSRKSPVVAAALAVVPGAGYVYAEHYGTAVASLIINGLLGWATVDAFRDGNDGAGGFFAVLGLGFYVGNITGSAQSADRYNTYQDERFQARFPE
jgi:tetratricopeptide (TPR) repeat protein